MREPFPLSGWLIVGFLAVVAIFLLAGPHSQATSHQPFTVEEIDAFPDSDTNGQWQYRAVAKTAPGSFSHWRDSPWHWRHYGQDAIDEEGVNCDETLRLFPADPASPDTAVSADGGTVTVNIYQKIDTVWVCFALRCDDGTYAYAKLKNVQDEKTISSGTCGHSLNRLGSSDRPIIDPTDSNPDNQQLDPIGSGPDELDNPGNQGLDGLDSDSRDGTDDGDQSDPSQNDQSDPNADAGNQPDPNANNQPGSDDPDQAPSK